MTILDQMRVLLREHQERAEDRKAAIKPDPPHVTVPLSLVRSTKLASWMAYFALVYFLWLYTLDIARDRAAALHITHLGQWVGDASFYFPYIVGFAVVAIGIPYVAKLAIPTFTRLSWQEAPTEKAWSLAIAVAVSLVVIAGTFTVQGDTILERDRASVVAVDQAAQAGAVLGSRIDDAQHRLDEMTRSQSQYVRTAASMSPAAYDAFVAARQGDPQYQRLVSYRATAVEAENLRNSMSELRAQQASQTVSSQVASRVTTQSNGWIAATLGWLEGARAMLLSFVMDIVCLIMPLIALRLELKRNQQLGMGDQSGWADEGHRIEDLRAEDAFEVQPMRGPESIIRDTDTGEVVIDKDGDLATIIKEHTRKKRGKDGKPVRVMTPVPTVADETGAPDGAARAGSVVTPEPEALLQSEAVTIAEGFEDTIADDVSGVSRAAVPPREEDDRGEHNEPGQHIPTPDLTAEEINELYPELAAEPTLALGSDGADGVMHPQAEQDTEEEPPVAPRALIAANIAAE